MALHLSSLKVALQALSWSDWCLSLSVATGLMISARIAYNLYLHPLSHIPGPFWARATGIPNWLAALRGKRHVWLWQQFQVYGSPIRPEPNTVLFCDPEAYGDIYSMKANVRRSKFYEALQRKTDEVSTITTTDVAEHRRRRKFLNICFSERMVREACEFVGRHVDRWNEILVQDIKKPREWSATLDLSHSLDSLMFDIMGDLNFGASFNIKEPGDQPFKNVPHIIIEYMQFYYPLCRSPFLNTMLWLKPRGLEALFELVSPPAIKAYFEFLDASVAKRLELEREQQHLSETQQRKDIFHFLYNAVDPKTGTTAYNDHELKCEAALLVVAGTDTTAVSLSAIFFYLSGNPRCLKIVEDELLSKFKSVQDIIHGSKLAGCEYLRACVDESIRLTPSGPADLPREILPGGAIIKGQHYPEGTIVGTSPYCDNRNQDIFGDVEVFRPERWIVNEAAGVTADDVARAKTGFTPFAAGPGHCVGKVFAISEIMLLVARTLYRLEVRRAPGSTFGGGHAGLGWGSRNPSQMQLNDAYISIRQGPEVQFRERK